MPEPCHCNMAASPSCLSSPVSLSLLCHLLPVCGPRDSEPESPHHAPSPCHFSVTFSRSVDRGTVNLDLPITPRLPVGSVSFSQSVDRWGQRVLISPSPPSPSRSSVIGLHRNRCLWTPQGQRVLVSCERHVFPSALCLESQGQRVLISVVPAVCSFQYRPTYVTGQNQTSGSFEVMTFNSPRRTRQR